MKGSESRKTPGRPNGGAIRYRPAPGDAVLAVIILAAALFLSFFLSSGAGAGSRVAVVMQYGEVVTRISLDGLTEPVSVDLDGATVTAENGRVRVSFSTCRNQYCVHTGWISEPGQSSGCLPNRVVVIIEGEADFDAISG